MAKKTRAPTMSEPFTLLKVESSTSAAITPAPAPASSGMRVATVVAISFEAAISGSGSTYRNARFTSRYTSATLTLPRMSARGSVCCGWLTSPPMNATSAQPS